MLRLLVALRVLLCLLVGWQRTVDEYYEEAVRYTRMVVSQWLVLSMDVSG